MKLQPARRHRARSLLGALACGASFAAAPALADADATLLGADVGSLIEHARTSNPMFAVERAEAAAARERVGAAGALPDPTFQVELMDFTNEMRGGSTSLVPGQVGETRYRITQPLPGWGKRELEAQAAGALAGKAEATREAAWLALVAEIRSAWLRYYMADREAVLGRNALALLQGLEETTLARYRTGLLPQAAVLRAQRELTAQRVALVAVEQRRQGAAAALNALLARAANAPLAAPGELPPLPAVPPFAELIERARGFSPTLAAEDRGMEAARLQRERTWRERYPDFAVGLTNNRPRGGEQSWDLMFEVMIPLQQSARRAREREALHMEEAAGARRAAAEATLLGELGRAHSTLTGGRDTARLLRGTLLPQAEATRDATRAAFANARVDFDSVLDAERQLIDTRMALLQAEVDARMALADMEKLTGEIK
ncbi:TolC family protein [Thauera sp. 2A1]|uniref:TolC family protein n=1 Tax=Thauera sp. 2A1 TaxID=2570191 RepID=UPI001292696F|nr:TolC family protein [Thauera sp. 2A1]KAI5914666.1 TolC family protein [Thauera sp. 2A1]